ncbi:MAG: glutathione S-transferase family protein [Pseudomonadota bacterium]
MADFTLIIGNRNYSSWSLRAWLVARFSGLAFDSQRVLLDTPHFKEEIKSLSPNGMVPALRKGDWVISDSLAIAEYLNECAPEAKLWPDERSVRAQARSLSCEMHSGFADLRNEMPMNIRATGRVVELSAGAQRDVERMIAVWAACLADDRTQRDGPWLFGRFSICDAMFVPVVFRFRTYSVTLPSACQAYADHCIQDPFIREWIEAALDETEILDTEEVGV